MMLCFSCSGHALSHCPGAGLVVVDSVFAAWCCSVCLCRPLCSIWDTYIAKQVGCGLAVQWYRRALALVPDSATSHEALGMTLHMMGDIQGALAHYHRALILSPHCGVAGECMGLAAADTADGVLMTEGSGVYAVTREAAGAGAAVGAAGAAGAAAASVAAAALVGRSALASAAACAPAPASPFRSSIDWDAVERQSWTGA